MHVKKQKTTGLLTIVALRRFEVRKKQKEGFFHVRKVNKKGKIYRYKYDGLRRRRNLRGNVISQETRQINLKIVEAGKRPLGVIFGVEEEVVPADQSSTEEE